MTAAITLRASGLGGPAEEGTSRVTGSFTPAASAKLYAWCWVQSPINTAFTTAITDSASLVWTLVASAGPITSSKGRFYLWQATTGGSPAAMTVTFNSTATATVAYAIFDVTGTSPGIKAGQIATNIQNDAFWGTSAQTSSLPAAATTGNLSLLCVGFNCDSSTALSTPSGWTSLASPSSPGVYELFAVFSKTDFTGTSVTYLNGADNEAIGSVLFEIAEGGAGPVVTSLMLAENGTTIQLEDGTILLVN